MEVGISEAAALLWEAFDPVSYAEAFLYSDAEGYWFSELPEWVDEHDKGPFFIDDEGCIWAVSMRPSQKDQYIGNKI